MCIEIYVEMAVVTCSRQTELCYFKNILKAVGPEFPTAVTVENIISWAVTPCSLVEFYQLSEKHTLSIFRVEE
jgi:hypothetical protein